MSSRRGSPPSRRQPSINAIARDETKEFYSRLKLPPYLHAATRPSPRRKSSAAVQGGERMDHSTSELYLSETGHVGEADAAAGSMLTRVRSLGRLRSPSAHQSQPPPETIVEETEEPQVKRKIEPSWHMKEKMRTACVGLVMALNIGTVPPDVTKPHPCAKLQTWMDPTSVSRAKAKEKIGERLQAQYAQWQQQRTATPLKYRRALDPTVEDVRALCLWLRRKAGNDRILFHYNGHGVPRPTASGELWLFDKLHTQYIPLCVTDLRQWLGKPNIVILDCSSAGVLMPFLTAPLESNNDATPSTRSSTPATSDMEAAASQWVSDTIVLCPTSENEWLPMNPEFPADIFTSCLTTPIQMALRWFVRCHPESMSGISPEAVDSIPGKAGDRKTPLGELTWIFAAVTDSIAWNVLPRPLFQRLFRQDLLVAGMFRNFLLADRILRSLNCSPQSYPPLPPGVSNHPLWEAWDLACETCLYGLMSSGILTNKVPASPATDGDEQADSVATRSTTPAAPAVAAPSVSSPFFSEQLSAFEIWLDFASIPVASGSENPLEPFESPEQLPIVLQVLLTPAYRVRALTLLRRFLDLGPYAVNLALSLGILPYVTKLLQSPEYKQDLMAIWAKILAFDPSCQQVVVKDGGLPHFISHLTWGLNASSIAIPVDPIEASSQRTLAAFILAIACFDFPRGQTDCSRLNLQGTCCSLLSSLEFGIETDTDPDFKAKQVIAATRVPEDFRMWLCICLGNLVKDNNLIQNQAFGCGAHQRLLARVSDDTPEVSAAACYALGCMLGRNRQTSRNSSRQDLQQQTSSSFPLGSTQAGLITNRLIAPPNAAIASGLPGRLQPAFAPGGAAQALGMIPLNAPQLPQGHPRIMQQTAFNPGALPVGTTGPGMVPSPSFGGRQMDNSFFERAQAPITSPQPSQNIVDSREQNSGFPDEHRIAYDASVAEGLLSATEDASAMVRYEAVISVARLVEKYLSAFVSLADKFNMNSAPDPKVETSVVIAEIHGSDALAMPDGLDDFVVGKFADVWKKLRFLQRHDPFPDVSAAAVSVVSFVHEHILRIKVDLVEKEGQYPGNGDGLVSATGKDTSGLRSLLSLPSISDQLRQDSKTSSQDDSGDVAPSDKRDKRNPLRRISSEYAEKSGWRLASKPVSRLEMPSGRSKSEGKVADQELHFIIDYDLPVSKFYEWQKDLLAVRNTDPSSADGHSVDPLSFEGAVHSYREQRNRRVYEACKKYTEHFASLAPKPPQPKKKKQRWDVDLSEEEEDGANEADANKKRELEMKQRNFVNNDRLDMSVLLKFHSFEDALCVCDVHDGISVWDSRKSEWACMFSNGNPKGTRMTSCTWVNETSNSLFLVGCDDGSVRVWDGLIQPNGLANTTSPSLCAAFFAVPGMVAGGGSGGSGLVLDWQQYSGRLIVGGSSSQIRCWDLNTEKCSSIIETRSCECVTTINTAWRYDPYASAPAEGAFGLGPDTIVVGQGDGMIKLFDIRANQQVAEPLGATSKGRAGRRARTVKYDEHSSWIVSTCLTGYNSRPELVSGSVDGEIKTWDLRLPSSLRTFTAQRRPMTALAVHPNIPLLATGSHAQFIKVITLDGDTVNVIRYHEESGHRIGPVSSLEFHPYKPLLAAGFSDSVVSIYSPKVPLH